MPPARQRAEKPEAPTSASFSTRCPPASSPPYAWPDRSTRTSPPTMSSPKAWRSSSTAWPADAPTGGERRVGHRERPPVNVQDGARDHRRGQQRRVHRSDAHDAHAIINAARPPRNIGTDSFPAHQAGWLTNQSETEAVALPRERASSCAECARQRLSTCCRWDTDRHSWFSAMPSPSDGV
ncbi:hypothetical protein FRAHR75_640043 [Frankia sp. Hr75.2]|nr:hypothetical protein FRAHR75_640043 [Frankia sp. Hr75.2]